MSGNIPDRGPGDGESDVDGATNTTKKPPKVGDKRKSEYWGHFWDVLDPTTGKLVSAKCKYCHKLITANTNNGTSSLKKHLNSCMKYPANTDKKQKLISVFRPSQFLDLLKQIVQQSPVGNLTKIRVGMLLQEWLLLMSNHSL